jgi:molybdate transport system ATP-binding protein
VTAPTQIRVRWARGSGFTLDVDVAWDARVAVCFGPSGSGKSTLLDAVLGLAPRAAARVRLAGEWLEDCEAGTRVAVERRRLGWVPQDPTLLPHLSVSGNLQLGMRRAGAEGPADLARAVEVLEIGALLDRKVDALSGGERQRVALARALASGPRALLLDEPLSSLDLPLRARVLPYLLRVRDELRLPMIYITHDPDEALLIGEWVVVLDAGKVVAEGTPRDALWSRPALPLSESLGLENVIDARVIEVRDGAATVQSADGLRLVIPSPVALGSAVRLGVRAQDLLLSADEPGRISARNVFLATVSAVEFENGDVHVHLDAGERLVAKVTRGAVEALDLRPGARTYVLIKATALRRLG